MEKIYTDLNNIINTYKPDAMSIEELFFNNNAKTAINVAQARGVILITARINKLDIFEYTPLQIKQAVTEAGESFPLRLEKIYTDLNNIINTYKPDAMSIEELFFNNNAKTAINVAQARGVILITARINKLDIFEYTPLQIKQAVTGYGRADKMQVQRMVKMILNTEKLPKLDDITDSMAIAICHAHSSKFSSQFKL